MVFYAVIGANYGDEGKGLITDHLARTVVAKEVVRFNGGAQAGHTVATTDGRRHVFSSYGSGSLAGLPTRHTQDVVLNPFAALMEYGMLEKEGVSKIRVSGNSPVTTQFEVAINQLIENRRAKGRHGSCGVGINETVERHEAHPELAAALLSPKDAPHALEEISKLWVPKRLRELRAGEDDINYLQGKLKSFSSYYVSRLESALETCFDVGSPLSTDPVIYEGAQGLGLDEDLGTFPFVTRSNTGLRNVLRDIKGRVGADAKFTLNVVYVTRCYLTRHGAGPLSNERPASEVLCGADHVDTTNITNPWQGSLRYAPLSVGDTCSRIMQDIHRNAHLFQALPNARVAYTVAVTCLDQADKVQSVDHGYWPVRPRELVELFPKYGLSVAFQAFGPTSSDVEAAGFVSTQGEK